MLRFAVTREGSAVRDLDLSGAYVVGSDGVPLRAELEFRDSQVICAKRADGPAALSLVWPVRGCGTMMLETSRLMDRDQPYNLSLELARGRLTRINLKREDWGLFDFEGVEPVANEINRGPGSHGRIPQGGHPCQAGSVSRIRLSRLPFWQGRS